MIIQHNIMALNAHRQLTGNTSQVAKNIEKLSSGYKINRAGDDASGLAISEKMRAQIAGLAVAQQNAQDGISLIQTAEGALTEVHSMLNRMVELAEKSANGTIQDDVDRDAIQKETDDLLSEIDRISEATNFNGIKLLDGNLKAGGVTMDGITSLTAAATGNVRSFTALEGTADATGNVTVAYKDASGADQTIDVSVALLNADTADQVAQKVVDALNADSTLKELFTFTANGASIESESIATGPLAKSAVTSVTPEDALITGGAAFVAGALTPGAFSSTEVTFTDPIKAGTALEVGNDRFWFYDSSIAAEDAVNGNNVMKEGYINIDVLAGGSFDTLAEQVDEIAAKAGDNVTSDGADGITVNSLTSSDPVVKINGKQLDGGTNSVTSGGGLTLQIGDTNESHQKVTVSVDDLSSSGLNIRGLDVSTQEAAGTAIAKIKDAINIVSTNRANLGGLQNRLDHTINNLSVTEENMTAAESRIRDVDMAKEMMAFTKNNVLTQAAQAMLAQANMQPQSVLQLLQ